jgi:hypothetical protein
MLKKLGLQVLVSLISAGFFIVSAQTSTVGNISGTVRDPKGAAVPNAEVSIKEERTGASRTAVTNDDGFYTALSLPVGRYSVSTAPPGFKKTLALAFDLHLSENKVVDLTLEVGQVSETVNVSAEAAQVETRSGDVTSLISEKQVTELPLNGRNYAQLVLLTPGISPVTQAGAGGAFQSGGTGLDSHVDMSVNGNTGNTNLWTVDGVNNLDVGSNGTLLVFPSIDAIAEFRVERNSFSAEFGQAQGAVINLVTKGGGNQFHGTGFEFNRSDKFNANDFFLNRAGQPKGKLKYNNYGFNFNGPVYIPWFGEGGKPYWSGKNRVFFFWSEEWRREHRGSVLSGHAPTAAEKVGDFSGDLTAKLADGSNNVPYVPGSCQKDADGNVIRSTCTFYPGNKIPTNLLSPAGLALVKMYPDANTSDLSGASWVGAPTQPVATRQDLIRGDANITSKMSVMVRWIKEGWTHGVASGNFWGDTPFPTVSSDWDQPSRSFAVKLTNTLSSTAVNEFQFSRSGNDIIINNSAESEALIQDIRGKFPTVFPHEATATGAGPPPLFWGPLGGGGYDTLWHQAPWTNHEDLYTWKDDFSKVQGSHDLKFGIFFGHGIKNEPASGAAGSNEPYAIQGCGNKTGNCIADLLVKDLPLINYAEIDHQEEGLGRWRDFEFYGNDTWKIRPRVTLTLGMRYSQFPAAWADNNHISNFIPRLYDGTDYKSALITADQASQFGLSRSLTKPYHTGFQPRVGLAWDIFGDGKTAVRMGFGRYLSRSQVIEDVLAMNSNPPWATAVDSGWSGENDTLASDPKFRSLDTINPGLRNAAAVFDPSVGFQALSETYRPPESYQWNLTISREVFKNTVLEASYIGNHGLHIWRRNVPFNDIPPNVACKGTACDGSSDSARLQIAKAVRAGADTDQLVKDNRRLPGIGPVSMAESTGNSHYNALQLWLNRRFTERLAFQVAYTWGHATSDVALTPYTDSVSDPFDYSLDKGDADLDRRHTFVANAVYVLPSFKKWGGFANHLLGDWQLNGIFSYFGSTPLEQGGTGVLTGVNTVGLAGGNNSQRPNLVPGVPIFLHTSDSTQYLNPAAFALPDPGQLGNLGRGAIRGKPINNVDFSLNKNWRMRERYGFQFRAEFFNLFNHPNFIGYDAGLQFDNGGNVTNPGFGRLTQTQNHREIQLGIKFTF